MVLLPIGAILLLPGEMRGKHGPVSVEDSDWGRCCDESQNRIEFRLPLGVSAIALTRGSLLRDFHVVGGKAGSDGFHWALRTDCSAWRRFPPCRSVSLRRLSERRLWPRPTPSTGGPRAPALGLAAPARPRSAVPGLRGEARRHPDVVQGPRPRHTARAAMTPPSSRLSCARYPPRAVRGALVLHLRSSPARPCALRGWSWRFAISTVEAGALVVVGTSRRARW